MILITFESRDKTCSNIENPWFLSVQWVAKSGKMSGKMITILINLSNNWLQVPAIPLHTAWSMINFTVLSSSKNNPKEIGNF